jgi:hypothetical protein
MQGEGSPAYAMSSTFREAPGRAATGRRRAGRDAERIGAAVAVVVPPLTGAGRPGQEVAAGPHHEGWRRVGSVKASWARRAPSYTLHVQLGTSARTTPAIAVATQSAARCAAAGGRRDKRDVPAGCEPTCAGLAHVSGNNFRRLLWRVRRSRLRVCTTRSSADPADQLREHVREVLEASCVQTTSLSAVVAGACGASRCWR